MPSLADLDLARVATAIGQPARAAMLGALLGGQWLTATELARIAGVSPPTASTHLAALVEAGLVRKRKVGRRRYHALLGPEVAEALEGLLRLSTAPLRDLRALSVPERALRFARTCYDHLAGEVGVLLTTTMVRRGLIAPAGTEVTAAGHVWLNDFGIDTEALRPNRRAYVRLCLDWSERRDHLAGAVGAAVTASLLARGWILRMPGTRAVRLTLHGRVGLDRVLGIPWNQVRQTG